MTAAVNLTTGKIIGAKRGSFAWFHEEGHIKFNDSELGIQNGVHQNMCVYFSLLFLVLGRLYFIFDILAGLSVAYLFGLVIYEEKWCDKYASEKIKGGNKK